MGDKNGTCEKCGKQLFIGIGHSEDSCREARLLRDYETLALAYDKLKEENDAALLQNSELQKEVERCKEIAERDGIDYSDAMLLVSELKTALENSRALVEANRLAIEMLEQEGIRVDGERDNLLRLNGELKGLLNEWLNTPFFKTQADWQKWVEEFRPRVVKVVNGCDHSEVEAKIPEGYQGFCTACKSVVERKQTEKRKDEPGKCPECGEA